MTTRTEHRATGMGFSHRMKHHAIAGRALMLALVALGGVLGCRDTLLSVVEVARVEIRGAPGEPILVGDTLQLEAVALSAAGHELSGRQIAWSSSDPAVLRPGPAGRAIALAPGTAVLEAEVEGRTARASVTVAPPATIVTRPDSVFLAVTRGTSTPASDSVRLTSGGAVPIRGLGASVIHPEGAPVGWLSVEVEGGATPALLRLHARAGALPTGRYTAVVQVHGRGATGVASIPVVLRVQSGIARWAIEVRGHENRTITGIWGSADDALATTTDGSILHFDGTRTSQVYGIGNLYSPASLYAVWGASRDHVFAVGRLGGIVQFDGSRWVRHDAGATVDLHGVWGQGRDLAYAVGSGGSIIRWDGVRWSPVAGPDHASAGLLGVGGSSAADVWAVGGRGTIRHFDGSEWRTVASGTSRPLRSVWSAGPGAAFAVGDSGTVLHFDGTAWRSVPSGTTVNLHSVRGRSGRDVYAVGDTGVLLHFDGGAWRRVESGTRAPLLAVSADESGAVAAGVAGTVASGTGTSWRRVQSAPTLRGVSGAGATVFTVGDFGTVLRTDGSAWSEMASGSAETLHDVWAASASSAFIAGARGTILRLEGSHWRRMESGTAQDLHAIWGTSPTSVYAAGRSGTVLHFDGLRWRRVRGSETDDRALFTYTDIWGAGDSGVHLVGHRVDHIFRQIMVVSTIVSSFDGAAWTDSPRVSGNSSSDYYPSNGIWGNASALFASTYPSGIYTHREGSWSHQPIGASIADLWGAGGTDVYGVGSEIVHFDGTGWSRLGNPAGRPLRGVWGRSEGEIVVVGDGSTILRGRR